MFIYYLFINSGQYEGNNRHSMLDFHKKKKIYNGSNLNKLLSKTMLSFLENKNSSIMDVYMYATSEIKSQLHHLHLKNCFMQQKQEQNFRNLC